MASLLSWLGDRLKDVEHGIGSIVGDVGRTVGEAFTPQPQQQQNRPQPQAPQPQQRQQQSRPIPFNTGIDSVSQPRISVPKITAPQPQQPSPQPAPVPPRPVIQRSQQYSIASIPQVNTPNGNMPQAPAPQVQSPNPTSLVSLANGPINHGNLNLPQVNDVGKFIAEGTARLANTGLAIGEKVGVHAQGEFKKFTGDTAGGDRTIAEGDKSINQRLLADGKGLFGVGGIYKSLEELHGADTGDVIRKAGGTGLEAASELFPIRAGIRLAEKVGSPLLQKIISAALEGGLGSSLGSVGAQLAQNGTIDLGETAKDAGTGAAISGVIPVLGAGLSKMARGRSNIEIPSIRPTQENPSSPALPEAYRQVPVEPQLAREPQIPPAGSQAEIPALLERATTAQESSSPSASSPNYTPVVPFNPKGYVNDMAMAQEEARLAGKPSRLSDVRAELKKKFVDSFAPIEDTLNKAEKAGTVVAPENNIKYQIDRALRADTIAGQYMKDNGLVDAITKVPKTKEFEQYLIAKHAKELEANGITTGRNSQADQQLVDALSPQYEPHAQVINKYSQDLLDKSVEYGLIDKATAKTLKEKYPNYVPFNRVFGDNEVPTFKGAGSGKASISAQTIVKKIKGSERQVESPLSSIIKKTQDVVTQGERNKTAQTLASYKDLPGNPFNLRELDKGETIGTKSTISYLDNGTKRTFETTPEIAAAAKSLNKEQLGLIGKVLAVPTRILRLGATGINAGFALANVAKDFGSAFLNSKHPFRMADPVAFGNALRAAIFHGSKQYGELVREGAGGTSFDIARGREPMNIKKLRSEKNIGTKALYTVTHPGELVRAVENTIGRSEEFGRALQYYGNKRAALKGNATESQARILGADAARNNTVNFARAGEYGRVLNSVLPYLNAGIQGARTFSRNVKDRPVQTFGKLVLTAFTPVAVATTWNLDDPQRKKAYDNISDYEKQNNIIIVPPNPTQDKDGRWNVIKIPLSQEVSNLSNIVRNGMEALYGADFNPGEAVGNVAGAFTSLNFENPRQTVGQFTPQAVKPVLESMLNQNLFTGQQVVPDSVKNLDPKDQTNKSTSGTAKVAGNIFGISPLQIDNAIKTATGGTGQNVVNATDSGLAALGVIKPEDVKGKDVLSAVGDRFDSAQGSTEGAMFFQALDKAAKDHKLAGNDLDQFNAIISKEIDPNGTAQPTDDKTKFENNLVLANNPNIAAARADAAKAIAKQTGKPLDPLYDLSPEQQEQYYRMQGSPRGGQDAANIKKKNADWLPTFQEQRSKFFNDNPIPSTNNSGTVPYPEDPPEVQALLDKYDTLDGDVKNQFLRDHPEISQSFANKAKYTNDVRQATGYDPIRTYNEASPRVQSILNSMPKGDDKGSKKARAQAFNDPEVATWMQNNSMFNLTKDAALAQIQGNDLTQKGLKALSSLGSYDIAKNPDGTLALKYGNGGGGSGVSGVQAGATDMSPFSKKSGGKKRGKGGKSSGSSRFSIEKTMSIKALKAPNLKKKGAIASATFKGSKKASSAKPKTLTTPKGLRLKKVA